MRLSPQVALTMGTLFMTSVLGLAPRSGASSSDDWHSRSRKAHASMQCIAKDPRREIKAGRLLIADTNGKPTGEYIARAFDDIGTICLFQASLDHDSHLPFWSNRTTGTYQIRTRNSSEALVVSYDA
jgi:hypothetical protein